MTVEEIKQRMCDDYCKMVDICETQERLDRHCEECSLNELSDEQPCEDAVSRQDVLSKKVYTETEEGWSGYVVDADYIEHLPSVIPQTECNDAVSRQDVLNYLETNSDDFPDYHEAIEVVLELPSVTQKSGKWIETDSDDSCWYMCSACHRRIDSKENYCPSCGARMRGDKNE